MPKLRVHFNFGGKKTHNNNESSVYKHRLKGKNEKWYFAKTYKLQTRANEIFVNKKRNGTDIVVYKFNDVEKMNRNNGICGILYFTVFYSKWSPEAKNKLVILANKTLFLYFKCIVIIKLYNWFTSFKLKNTL